MEVDLKVSRILVSVSLGLVIIALGCANEGETVFEPNDGVPLLAKDKGCTGDPETDHPSCGGDDDDSGKPQEWVPLVFADGLIGDFDVVVGRDNTKTYAVLDNNWEDFGAGEGVALSFSTAGCVAAPNVLPSVADGLKAMLRGERGNFTNGAFNLGVEKKLVPSDGTVVPGEAAFYMSGRDPDGTSHWRISMDERTVGPNAVSWTRSGSVDTFVLTGHIKAQDWQSETTATSAGPSSITCPGARFVATVTR